MANTLTSLIPDLHSSLDVVSREMTGFIPAVTIDATTSRAAKDQTVRSFVAPAASAGDITPAATTPDDGDQTIGNVSLSISKARRVPIRWNGEQELGANSGPGAAAIRAAQIQQAIRTLVNEIESDLAGLHAYASRAAGTAATTPFGTANDYTGASLTRKILADNGAPMTDLQLVIDTTAGANIRGKQAASADAGGDSILRQGVLLDINGFMVRESAQVKAPTAGSVSGTLASLARAVGVTSLTTSADYTSTLLAGDVITIAGDTNQYVITSVAAGAITIGAPGLMQATTTGTKAITVVATARRNMGFHRSAIVLAHRLPALPQGGDMAVDRTTITDPRSGLSFEVAMYPQYRQMQFEISCAWGVKLVKPEHCALLLG
ncbi:MAG: P22 phage major capsid protein family protein [Bacteroidia bacterium]